MIQKGMKPGAGASIIPHHDGDKQLRQLFTPSLLTSRSMLISWFGGYGMTLFYIYCLTGVSAGAGPHMLRGAPETIQGSGTWTSNDVLVECRDFTTVTAARGQW
jgi:hypothetical protein